MLLERDGDIETNLCRMSNVKDTQTMYFTMHDVVREYLKANSPVSPVIEGKVTLTDDPQDLLSQLADPIS